MLMLLRVATSESMKPSPYFQALIYHFSHFCYSLPCFHFYYRIILLCFTTHITHILSSLHRTSAPIQLTIVLGALGTQETSCILIEGPFEGYTSQPTPPLGSINLGHLSKGNLLLSYKPLRLEAQHSLQK